MNEFQKMFSSFRGNSFQYGIERNLKVAAITSIYVDVMYVYIYISAQVELKSSSMVCALNSFMGSWSANLS